MKKFNSNKLFLTCFSLLSLFALMSNSSGRANIFGQAVTGAPGDSNKTCASAGCHSSGAFSPNAQLSILDDNGNAANQYVPGNTYDITLAISSTGSPSAFGFQMVALDASNTAATEWKDLGSNVQAVQLGERVYIEHNAPSISNEFKAKWVAPSEASGDVTFYFAANAVNKNGSNSGDGGTNATFILPEITTSSDDYNEDVVLLYPNPAQDVITIGLEEKELNYLIFDINGKVVKSSSIYGESNIDISDFIPGLYIINLQYEGQTFTKKLIKN